MKGMMQLASLLAAGALLFSQPADARQSGSWCRSHPDRNGQCREVRGRLAAHNGNPTFRIWTIGTHRLLGVVGRSWNESESGDMLPGPIRAAFGPNAFQRQVIADFLVCPLSRERAGAMQFVCMVRAGNLHVRRP